MAVKEHFVRMKALSSGGWLHRLTLNELAMFLVYEQHADPEGISRPGSAVIAAAIGHSTTNNISRLRKALIGYGLIEILSLGGASGPKDSAVVRMLVPPSAQGSLFPLSTPTLKQFITPLNREGGNNGLTPLKSDTLPPSKALPYPPQKRLSHNKEEQLIQQLREQGGVSSGGSDFGILKIIELGEKDPSKAIREFHDAAQLDGWELSSLPPALNDPAGRFKIAVFFVNLKTQGKAPSQISWRGQLRRLNDMGRDRALAALDHSIANNYAGLVEPKSASGNRGSADDSPEAYAARIMAKSGNP